MSAPLAISMTWLRRALGLSLVTNIGGFGLFFEPDGRPLGRRVVATSIAPSFGSSLFSFSSSSSSLMGVLLFMEKPKSGFFMGGELVELSTMPRPTESVHHRCAITVLLKLKKSE
ncbi:hypothetical protein Lal_00000492 [Lupinus albus]|nr:hypothetical protein Lal_00000492 [Lupinus albus]